MGSTKREAVLDIQFYHGTGKVREVAFLDMNTFQLVYHNCFSLESSVFLPNIPSRSDSTVPGFPDNNPSFSENLLYQVVKLLLSNYDFTFVKGIGKGLYLKNLFPDYQIHLLDCLRCPSVTTIDNKLGRCWNHPNPRWACAKSRAFALAWWCRQNEIDMFDYNTRLLTFTNWTANNDPELLAKNGFVQWNRFFIRCVYCNVFINGWEAQDKIAVQHSWTSQNCPTIK